MPRKPGNPPRKCGICQGPVKARGSRKCPVCKQWQCPDCVSLQLGKTRYGDAYCLMCERSWALREVGRQEPWTIQLGVFGLWVHGEPVKSYQMLLRGPRRESKHRRGQRPGTGERHYNGSTGRTFRE